MENLAIYNQLSDKYNELFYNNIIQFQKNCLADQNPINEYVDFYPSFGMRSNERCEFLIYGQAVDGWGTGFRVNEVANNIHDKVKESIAFSNGYFAEKNHCPLDWVNVYWSKKSYFEQTQTNNQKAFYEEMDYRTFRSFFWNVTYKLICKYYELDINSWEWAKKIVWSNLYKIAPLKGNPNRDERRWQQELSIKLVKKEIEEINPKYCIVLTNEDWWNPFRQSLSLTQLDHKNLSEIICFEQYNETRIIVTIRPPFGNHDRYVTQILKLIESK